MRAAGVSSWPRLELGGLQPVMEGKRERVLRVVREAFVPARRRSGPSGSARGRRGKLRFPRRWEGTAQAESAVSGALRAVSVFGGGMVWLSWRWFACA